MLRVPPEVFRNGSRIFMRELSAVLNTIAFIKRQGNEEMIFSFDIKTRKRRQVVHLRVVRAADGTGLGKYIYIFYFRYLRAGGVFTLNASIWRAVEQTRRLIFCFCLYSCPLYKPLQHALLCNVFCKI